VGLCTGDASINPDAPIIVATLETQKRTILNQIGPALLVIDEYQMLNDEGRGLNYELVIAAAPPNTQLLLMSGSVGNPADVANWLIRIGRNAEIVAHYSRPVPQDEIQMEGLKGYVPKQTKGYWPKMIQKALANDLGPILIFAPKRHASEQLAKDLAEAISPKIPLTLSSDQKRLAKDGLSSLLKKRISYHHSGLSYQQRAALIEPLAKAGELQIVVATTGLGAGINFSMRSVLIIDKEYRQGDYHHILRPDELLQMFGRAGRRGLDDKGYILTTPGKPSLRDAKPIKLVGKNQIDWPSFINILQTAQANKQDPVQALRALVSRLFSEQVSPIGMQNFLKLPLKQKEALRPKRAKNSKTPANKKSVQVIEILNSNGLWERKKGPIQTTADNAFYYENQTYLPALESSEILKDLPYGNLCKISKNETSIYGRELPLARFPEKENEDSIHLTKWFYQLLKKHKLLPQDKTIIGKKCPYSIFEKRLLPRIPKLMHGATIHELVEKGNIIYAKLDFSSSPVYGTKDESGKILINPPHRQRDSIPNNFQGLMGDIQHEAIAKSTAEQWFALGLIDTAGYPTPRGIIFSYFNHGEGLAISAALEDPDYPIGELIWDLANLRAGYRFSENASTGDRLASCCYDTYGHKDVTPYLKKGLPIEYGEGASEVLSKINFDLNNIRSFITKELKAGDIERAYIEWINLLNAIQQAPEYNWDRWIELKNSILKFIKKRKITSCIF
jgi:superfamily II DNA/RNA helicase